MKFRPHRHPTRFVVNMVVNGVKTQSTIVDVNEGGGRLTGVPELQVGDQITLSCSFGQTNGLVRWVKGEDCGIEFRPRISKGLVSAFCKNGASMTGGRFSTAHLREM